MGSSIVASVTGPLLATIGVAIPQIKERSSLLIILNIDSALQHISKVLSVDSLF